jgi:hypothetical protein
VFILANRAHRPFLANNLYRHDFLRQNPRPLRFRRQLLAAKSEGILIGPADI